MAQQVIAQIVNRIFVGLPICERPPTRYQFCPKINIAGRDKAYLKMMIGYTMHVIGSSFMIKLFPKALHPSADLMCVLLLAPDAVLGSLVR